MLPMWVLSATHKFQAKMVGLFVFILEREWPDPYIDDILHTKVRNFDEHLQILDKSLERL